MVKCSIMMVERLVLLCVFGLIAVKRVLWCSS